MSNSRKDSMMPKKHKVSKQDDKPQSVDKSLDTDTAPQNASARSKNVTKDNQAVSVSLYSSQKDLNIENVGSSIKSTSNVQRKPTRSASQHDRKVSCPQEKDKRKSKKGPETKYDVSEDKCASQTSNPIKLMSTISFAEREIGQKSDILTSIPEDKSDEQTGNNFRDKPTVSPSPTKGDEAQHLLDTAMEPRKITENSPIAPSPTSKLEQKQSLLREGKPVKVQSDTTDKGEKITSTSNVKSSEMFTNASEKKCGKFTARLINLQPDINLIRPLRTKSVKALIGKFENLADSTKGERNKTKPENKTDNEKIITVAETSMISPESIFPSISPEKIQPSSKEKIDPIYENICSISPEKFQPSSKEIMDPLYKNVCPISPEKIQPSSEERIDPIYENMHSISPEKFQPSSEEIMDPLYKNVCPINPEKIQPSFEEIIDPIYENMRSISPEKIQPSSEKGIHLYESTYLSNSPEQIQSSFKERINPIYESMSSNSSETIQPSSEDRINPIYESISSISPEKIHSSSKARTNVYENVSPSINTRKIYTSSKARSSLPCEMISPLISPQLVNSTSKARKSLSDERTSTLISPQKVDSSVRAMDYLSENTSPKKQSGNVPVQTDVKRKVVMASDAQSIPHDGAIHTVSTSDQEIGTSSLHERQNDPEGSEESPIYSVPKKKRPMNLQGSIGMECHHSDIKATTLKDPAKGMLPLSKYPTNTLGEMSSFLSSKEPAENIAIRSVQSDMGRETKTTSDVRPSVVQGGAKPKVNIGEMSKKTKSRRDATQQRNASKGALGAMDCISLKGMENLELLLQETENRRGKMYPRLDWLDETEEIKKTELVTSWKMDRLLKEDNTEQCEIVHDQIFRESRIATDVKCTASSNDDSSVESRSDLLEEDSKNIQPFSKLKDVEMDVDEDKPKETPRPRSRVLGSKPTEIESSEHSSLEKKSTSQFSQICRENSLLKELMRQKRTNQPEECVSAEDLELDPVSATLPLQKLSLEETKRSPPMKSPSRD